MMEDSMDQNLIGIREMSEKLSVPVSWLYQRTRTDEIPHYKIGKYVRFDVEQVMEWIKTKQNKIIEERRMY
jgi:excisionase family DNA binding protein